MKARYDVVVVGAGPAGLLAAKAAAENGFEVAIIERKEKIPVITRTCGQSLLPPNEYFFGNLFHYNERDKRFCFPNVGLSFPYTGPIKKIYDWYLVSPVMNYIRFGYPEGYTPPIPGMMKAPIALVYDKEVLLKNLLSELKHYQVDIFEHTEFTDITWAGPGVIVTAGGTQFKSSFVIAADGTNSRVVERLGFNHDRKLIANIYVKSFFIRGFKSQTDIEPILTGVDFLQEKPVYIFALPRPQGEEWNVLFLTFEKSLNISDAAEQLMKESRFARSFKDTQKVRECAAMEHIYSPIIKPFKNNVLAVGDAASCQELECLGAMISGWKGGLAVAAALKEFQLGVPPQAIADYCDWWLNTYIKKYDYQGYLEVFGVAYMFSRQDIIDYIFGLLKEPFPPTFNPYTAVRLLGAAMQKVMPQVLAERPDIVQELLPRLFAFPSEILSKTLAEEPRPS
jgi:flavin-dependent dehydrogenase